MPKGFLESIIFHLLILGFFAIPIFTVAKREIVPAHSIPVIFDKIDKNATPSQKSRPRPKYKNNKTPENAKPKSKPKAAPVEKPKKTESKKPEVKKIPDKPKPIEEVKSFDSFIDDLGSAKSKPKENFDSVLKDLTPEKYQPKEEETAEEQVSQSIQEKLSDNFTVAEEDALRAQIMNNWLVPIGAKDIEKMQVDISIDVMPGGEVVKTKIVHNKYYQRNNRAYDIFVKSAERAILKSSPLKLSDERMKVKSNIIFHFSPTDMF